MRLSIAFLVIFIFAGEVAAEDQALGYWDSKPGTEVNAEDFTIHSLHEWTLIIGDEERALSDVTHDGALLTADLGLAEGEKGQLKVTFSCEETGRYAIGVGATYGGRFLLNGAQVGEEAAPLKPGYLPDALPYEPRPEDKRAGYDVIDHILMVDLEKGENEFCFEFSATDQTVLKWGMLVFSGKEKSEE